MDKAGGSTSLDLAKAAKLLTDVAVVESEADLSGLDVLEADEGFLRDAGQQVRAQAQVGATAGCHGLQTVAFAQPAMWVASVCGSQQASWAAPSVTVTAGLRSAVVSMDNQLASRRVAAWMAACLDCCLMHNVVAGCRLPCFRALRP